MGKKYNFDYVVIGGGPAGMTAATLLAKGKKRVAIVEGKAYGGANINTRDVPYGVSLGFSHAFRRMTTFPEVRSQDVHFNFPTVVASQEYVVTQLSDGLRQKLEDAGVTCIDGYAHFLDKNTIAVGDQQYTADTFILATGSHLKTSEITGLDTVSYLTPETAIKMRRLPKVVFVIGGGPAGCEIAEYFAELGAKVLIMERGPRLLPREDPEAGQTLTEYFTNELGVMVVPNSKVVALEQEKLVKRVIFTSGEQEKMVRVDCVVLATGSEPVVDYGLENAGVQYKRVGVLTNRVFQTTAKNIYAIGDVTGEDSSTERAEYDAMLLATNLLNHTKAAADHDGFIRRVNTYPEVVKVGLNERELAKRGIKCKKALVRLSEVPASEIYRMKYGFVKILADKTKAGRILGATIVAPEAGLLAEELALAIRHHLTVLEVASTPHLANHWSAAVKLAAKQLVTKK